MEQLVHSGARCQQYQRAQRAHLWCPALCFNCSGLPCAQQKPSGLAGQLPGAAEGIFGLKEGSHAGQRCMKLAGRELGQLWAVFRELLRVHTHSLSQGAIRSCCVGERKEELGKGISPLLWLFLTAPESFPGVQVTLNQVSVQCSLQAQQRNCDDDQGVHHLDTAKVLKMSLTV